MDVLQPPREHAAPAGPMLPAPAELVSTRRDTSDTWTIALRPLSGEPFAFAPGQFVMLSSVGHGEVPISISGDPAEPECLIHTVRSVGLATAAICQAQPGAILGVRGPFGTSWPVQAARGGDVVIAAGGIGLPPLRGAILEMLAAREHYGRLVLLYGGRSPDQLLFTEELERWQQRGLEVLVTVDSAGPEWLGHVGVVTRLVRRAGLDPVTTVAMMCGPEVMMRFLVVALGDVGLSADRMYVSMERNMQCGIGHCGHCQLGPTLVCRDGAVFCWETVRPWLAIREL
ncbi:MAG TPA: FAD/NAD(P)-binding protein [Solirubrobacteraceae bacterium]